MRLVASLALSCCMSSLAVADDAITATAPPAPTGYPLRRIDRPRTLPEGMLQASLSLSGDKEAALASRADLFYAPVTDLEARISYAPQLTEGRDFEKPVVASLRYNTLKLPSHLFVATQIDIPINTTGDTFTNVIAGLPTKLKFNRTLALYVGDRLFKADTTEEHLVLVLNVPVELGLQLEDHIFVQLGTTLATVSFHDPGGTESMTKSTSPIDEAPVMLGSYFSPTNRLDIGAQFGVTDAQYPTRSLLVAMSLAFRGGL